MIRYGICRTLQIVRWESAAGLSPPLWPASHYPWRRWEHRARVRSTSAGCRIQPRGIADPIRTHFSVDKLESGVADRLREARRAVTDLVEESAPAVEVLTSLNQWQAIAQAAVRLIDGSQQRLYVSTSAAQLADLVTALRHALDRGVDVVVLCFGPMPLDDHRVKLFRLLSTEGVIYRSHQVRHLALIADSESAVWALAKTTGSWSAVETTSELVIAALKGFTRHDIDMQQVFDDFGPALIDRYGSGLAALESYRGMAETSVATPTEPRASRAAR